jgi:hypothetical protein
MDRFTYLISGVMVVASSALFAAPIKLTNVAAAGAGCQEVAKEAQLVSNGQLVIIHAANGMEATSDSLRDRRKACQIILDLETPEGQTYVVKQVFGHAHASVDQGVTASADVTLYFQGALEETVISDQLQGPADDILWLSRYFYFPIQAPCAQRRALNVKVSARITGEEGSGIAYLDEPIYLMLQAKKCGKSDL